MNTSMLVKRYTDYKQKNAQIKARQKVEREQELLPYLEDIGGAVADLRAGGTSVVDQAEAVTNKNRNFLYAALRAFEVKQAELTEEAPVSETEGELLYHFKLNGNSAEVSIGREGTAETIPYVLYLSDGVVEDYPAAWITAEDKQFYKSVIEAVERAAATE